MEHEQTAAVLGLPFEVASRVDLGRLVRELEMIDEALLQLQIRNKESGAEIKMPITSRMMDLTVQHNKLNLLQAGDRVRLGEFLHKVKETAPTIHISFSSDPSSQFIARLTAWLRQEVNPLVLITVGLQPNLGAGCVVRTTNQQFDLSLRHDLAQKGDILLERLREIEA